MEGREAERTATQGVFDAHQTCHGDVHIFLNNALVEHLLDAHVMPVAREDGVRLRLPVVGDPASFAAMDVRARVGHDRVRWLDYVRPNGKLVGL